jgi:membrane protein
MVAAIQTTITTLKKAFRQLQAKDPLVLSSATAFFATFSISPIIVILVSLFGLYSGSNRVSHQLFRTIGATFGKETAEEIETIVNNFLSIETNWLFTIAGSLFFLFVGTTMLGIIKLAIQKVWNIKSKHQSGYFKHHGRARVTQVAIILFTGFLFVVSLFVDTSMGMSLDYLQVIWAEGAIVLIKVLNVLFSLLVITIWFSVIFKILPEATVKWETAFAGGLLTAVLFTIGKLALGKILVHARFETIFGASASFALLLLFIFYSSFILYYGAAFTHAYGETVDNRICASKYTDEYEERVIENTDAGLS